MSVLEQRIIESGEASIANASFVEMQQVNLNSEMLFCSTCTFSRYFFIPLRYQILCNSFGVVTDGYEIDDPVQREGF